MILKIYWWFWLLLHIWLMGVATVEHGKTKQKRESFWLNLIGFSITLPWLILLWPVIMK